MMSEEKLYVEFEVYLLRIAEVLTRDSRYLGTAAAVARARYVFANERDTADAERRMKGDGTGK